MSPLDQLVRLRTWTLEEHRRRLGGLEGIAGQLRAEISRLDADLEQEKRIAATSLECSRALPAYAAHVRRRRGKIVQSLAELAEEIERARGEVEAEFQELKKYEQAARNRRNREHMLQQRRERIENDEVGITMFRRRR